MALVGKGAAGGALVVVLITEAQDLLVLREAEGMHEAEHGVEGVALLAREPGVEGHRLTVEFLLLPPGDHTREVAD
jgi:hypothetical protein